MSKYPFIATYMMASGRNGTLYLGVTSDLRERVRKHKSDAFDGFSKRYGCKSLVWFERHHTMEPAIEMETRMKGWKRRWKLAAIEAENPEWRDLSDGWFDETVNLWLLDPDTP